MELEEIITYIRIAKIDLYDGPGTSLGEHCQIIRFYNSKGDIGAIRYNGNKVLRCSAFIRQPSSRVIERPDISLSEIVEIFF